MIYILPWTVLTGGNELYFCILLLSMEWPASTVFETVMHLMENPESVEAAILDRSYVAR